MSENSIDSFKADFFPVKARAEQAAQMMNETGIDSIQFTLETKPTMKDGEYKSGGEVYKCQIWRIKGDA